jgi:threonine/homoserine/homoserine lactone efflux protein
MEKTLSEGRYKGFVSSLGMITVDVLYGLIALFGFRYVEELLLNYQVIIKIVSGILIFGLGYKIFRNKDEVKDLVEDDHYGYIKSYITTILVALANPLTIFTFIGLFAILGISSHGEQVTSKLALGIIIGGASQWFLITWALAHYRTKITLHTLGVLRHYASVIIMSGGILISLSSLIKG